MDIKKLRWAVSQHLAQHPEDADEVLSAVAEGLREYKTACMQQRDAIMDNALLHMMSEHKPKGIPGSIDAAFLHFPTGVLAAYSATEKAWWEQFMALAKFEFRKGGDAYGVFLVWLRSVKGDEYFRWWAECVECHLGDRT